MSMNMNIGKSLDMDMDMDMDQWTCDTYVNIITGLSGLVLNTINLLYYMRIETCSCFRKDPVDLHHHQHPTGTCRLA